MSEQGRFVEEIYEASGMAETAVSTAKVSRRLRLTEKERADFLRQLAQALQAQLPIVAALQVAGSQSPALRVRKLAGTIGNNGEIRTVIVAWLAAISQ